MVRPPTAAATTGVPVAWASAATSPKDSLYDGTATSVAAAYHRASSACETGGTNRTTSVEPELGGEVGERLRLVEAGAGRAADDRDDDPGAAARLALEQRGHRAEQHVGRLERLDPAGEEQDVGVRRQPEPGARRALRHGPEDVEVDAGVDDLDPRRVGVVQLDQLLGLEVGAGDQHVGGLDHLLLADHPRRAARGCRPRRGRRS